MIHLIHNREVDYNGEQCGFYKFNGIIWDYIDMDMGMFIHGLGDVSIEEARTKLQKLHDSLKEQLSWDRVPEVIMRSTFLAPQKPRAIGEVRATLHKTMVVVQRLIETLK